VAGIASLLPIFLLMCQVSGASEPTSQAPRLDEIIVVAQKREQNLQDVPISISVWSGDKIAEANIADLQELSATLRRRLTLERHCRLLDRRTKSHTPGSGDVIVGLLCRGKKPDR